MRITADQALAWRLHRQFLSPRTAAPVTDIVQRLGGVQMQLASAAQTAVTTRQQEPAPGEIATGLANGTLIKTWAMRGTLHLCTPGSAAEILSLVASARTWTKTQLAEDVRRHSRRDRPARRGRGRDARRHRAHP